MKSVSLTPIGEILQILREQNKETAAAMAKKLGVSASFLSQVENGKAKAPQTWATKLKKLYKCNYINLEKAIEETASSIILDCRNATLLQRKAAMAFVQKWPVLTNSQARAILELLENQSSSSSSDGA